MAQFVLVHGSGQNARCWSRVGDVLQSRGHSVAAPELPKQATDWGLEDFAAEVARSITGPQSVVVGHSISGVFLPQVPRIRRCALLVFLAAVIPEPGKSARDQFTEDPSMFGSDWIKAGARWFDPREREDLAKRFLFHDCDDGTLAWALPTVEPMDTRHLVTQPSPKTGWPDVSVASIVATEDRTISPDWIRRTSLRVLGREPVEVNAGHCPHVSRPVAIADLLETLLPDAATDEGPR